MFRITEDPSSEGLVQCLAKITKLVGVMAAYAAITPTMTMSSTVQCP